MGRRERRNVERRRTTRNQDEYAKWMKSSHELASPFGRYDAGEDRPMKVGNAALRLGTRCAPAVDARSDEKDAFQLENPRRRTVISSESWCVMRNGKNARKGRGRTQNGRDRAESGCRQRDRVRRAKLRNRAMLAPRRVTLRSLLRRVAAVLSAAVVGAS